MEKNYSNLFKNLEPIHMPEGLLQKTLLRIERAERRSARFSLAVSIPLAFVSAVAVAFSFQYLAQELARSGFNEYFSVIFSDGGAVLTYWKEFALSLAEQVPILGTALFLGAVLALLGSLKSIAKNAQATLTYA